MIVWGANAPGGWGGGGGKTDPLAAISAQAWGRKTRTLGCRKVDPEVQKNVLILSSENVPILGTENRSAGVCFGRIPWDLCKNRPLRDAISVPKMGTFSELKSSTFFVALGRRFGQPRVTFFELQLRVVHGAKCGHFVCPPCRFLRPKQALIL